MAGRRSGLDQFGSSHYNPLTGVTVSHAPPTDGSVDRLAVNYFIKQQPGQPAYQPPVKPLRTALQQATDVPAPIAGRETTIFRSLAERDERMTRPISQEHVLRRPQTAGARGVVHLQTPPPWATDDVVLTASHASAPGAGGGGGTSRVRSKSAHSNTREAAGMATGLVHRYRNNTSTTNVLYADDASVLMPTTPSGQMHLKRTVESYLSSVKLQEQRENDDGYQLPTSPGPSYMRHTRSSSQHGSRAGSRSTSRRVSPDRSRQFGHAAEANAILHDIQTPPHRHPLDSYRSGVPKEALPPAGQRSNSKGPMAPFLSSVQLDHPLDFVACDIGMPKQYQRTVRDRVTHQQNPGLTESHANEGRRQSAPQSGAQTPRAYASPQRQQEQSYHDPQYEQQSYQEPQPQQFHSPAHQYQSNSGFVSGAATPQSQRPGAWAQSPPTTVHQPTYVETPGGSERYHEPYPSNHSQQQQQEIDAFVPASRGDSEAPSRAGAGHSSNPIVRSMSPARSTASSVHTRGAERGQPTSGTTTPRHHYSLSGSATPRQQLTSPPTSHLATGAISPRVQASLDQRPAGIGGVNAKKPRDSFALSYAVAEGPAATVAAATSAGGHGHGTPQRQASQQQQAQQSHAPQQQQHQIHSPPPSQPPQQQQQPPQPISSSPTPRSSFTPTRTSSAQSARQAQVAALQHQLAALQSELRNIHSEASSGMTTPHSSIGTPGGANLRVQPANEGIFHALVQANRPPTSGQPQSPPQPHQPQVIIHPKIGNSSTGFRPADGMHTPKASQSQQAKWQSASPFTTQSHDGIDPNLVTHRPPAGRVSKQHLSASVLSPTSTESYSIACPPPAPARFHPSIHSASAFEGGSLAPVRQGEVEPRGTKRVERKPFVHPDDESEVEVITQPAVFHDGNTATNGLPMGGPLLYDRYEPRPENQRRRRAPGSRENVTSAYYQESTILSVPTYKVVPKKAPVPKLWKV